MYYLADLSVKPIVYNPPPGAAAAPRRLGNYAHFPVRVHDARPNAASISLDREGFAADAPRHRCLRFLRRGRIAPGSITRKWTRW